MAKGKGGRPSVITENLLAKLEEGFAMGFTDNEACLYADINPSTLYRYIDKNPEFSKRKEYLKDQPKMKAKMNVLKKIKEGDDFNARWYLERKSKDEFSLKQEIDQKTEINFSFKELEEASDEDLEKFINS